MAILVFSKHFECLLLILRRFVVNDFVDFVVESLVLTLNDSHLLRQVL